MSMINYFGSCSGACKDCITHYTGGCLAGHGDDDFQEITEKQAIKLINKIPRTLQHELLKKFPFITKHIKE